MIVIVVILMAGGSDILQSGVCHCVSACSLFSSQDYVGKDVVLFSRRSQIFSTFRLLSNAGHADEIASLIGQFRWQRGKARLAVIIASQFPLRLFPGLGLHIYIQ
jgi:hypothetical protein